MKSNIYICKETKSFDWSNITIIINQKYIIEDINGPSSNLTSYRIKDPKDNKEILVVFKPFINKYFNSLEDIREDKLNILFNGR